MFGHTARACRFGWRLATFAALALLTVSSVGAAQAETRYLKFYHLHTHEKGVFPYKVNGRYDSSELKKINYILRDWRKNQAVTIDPQLLDLIWEAYRQSGSNGYINVICGYRSPATNNMLRSRSSGVAQKSQHTLGKALDFYIPGVPLKKMREIGLRMQVGGVGYYPTSGSPFVHFDVGRARHWPRMSRSQLLAVFPHGNTVHVPSDGKPLPGYQQALASYKQRRGAADIQVANAGGRSSGGGKTLLSFLFGGGSDEADDEADVEVAPARVAPAQRQTPAPANVVPEPEIAVAAVIPQSRPTIPGGIAVTVPDVFDTSRSQPVPRDAQSEPPSEPRAEPRAEPEAPTQMAMLEPARVPFPTFKPQRPNVGAVAMPAAGRTALAPAFARAEVAPAEALTVSALVADLQAQDEREKQQTAAEEQLAYLVPTPRDRPVFEAPVEPAGSDPGSLAAAVAAKALTKGGLLSTSAHGATSIDERTTARVAAIAPTPAPVQARTAIQAPSRRSLITEASTPIDVQPKSHPLRSTFSAVFEGAAPISKGGKGNRVRGTKTASSGNRLKVAPVNPQDVISSRIAMASLTTDPGRRATKLRTSMPDTARLVGNVPDTLYAEGFSSPGRRGHTDSFSGTAVTFLPVVKINP